MIPISINDPKVPKDFRKHARQLAALCANLNIEKLRAFRERSKRYKVDIYHHSEGTDSYFHDVEGRYYTWSEVEAIDSLRMARGERFSTIVLPYRAGIVFTKSSILKDPSLN